ncbi:MAG: RNA polymerase sigma factor SigI [Eubacteriales bacterium]
MNIINKTAFGEEYLAAAKEGDHAAREEILGANRLFIYKVACRFCRKQLQWGRDDELSVALIAFNDAIDKYLAGKNVPFPVFARMVIKHRLIDYFRKENKLTAVSFNEDSWLIEEKRLAQDTLDEETITRERREEIKDYEALLKKYGLDLKELARSTPKHKQTCRQFIGVASRLAENEKMFAYFVETSKLPLKELELACGIPRKTLERHRKYIAAISLVFGYPEEFTHLLSYLKF